MGILRRCGRRPLARGLEVKLSTIGRIRPSGGGEGGATSSRCPGSDTVRGNKGEQEEAVAAVMAADSEKGEDAAQKHEKGMWLVAAFWR